MDDRDRELEDLRSRLAAVEKAVPGRPPKRQAVNSARSVVLYGIAALLAAIILLASLGKWDQPSAGQASASRPEVVCNDSWASEMIAKAQQVGIIERMDVSQEGLIIVVNGRLFDSLSYAAKEQIAVAADCQVAGNGKHLTMIRFRRYMRGEDLANFKGIDLMNARATYAGSNWARAD